ncbi:MAG TPA: c-type cytochrome domain-containing protein [Kofleriaceae bacterium]
MTVTIALTACGTEPDSRPATIDYIVDAVLAPQCAVAGCHTAASQAHGYAFDTVDDTLAAFHSSRDQLLVDPGQPDESELYVVLISSDKPMPPAWTLPHADIELVKTWIDDGAPGYTP